MACEAEQAAYDNEVAICGQLLVEIDDLQTQLNQLQSDYAQHYTNAMYAYHDLQVCQNP